MKNLVLGTLLLCLLVAGCAQREARVTTATNTPAPSAPNRAPSPEGQSQRFLKTAVEITGSFEGNDPWAKITGDFDDQGLTCGVLGFTFANGEQQGIVRKLISRYGEEEMMRWMPQTGADYLRLIKSGNTAAATREISDWTLPPKSNARVREPHARELERFWSSLSMQEIQLGEIAGRGRNAEALAAQWEKPGDLRTYCHFYDMVVFHGLNRSELSGQMNAVDDWLRAGADALFADMARWAESLPTTTILRSGKRVPVTDIPTLKRNIPEWKGRFASAEDNVKRLFVQGYVESKSSNTQFKAVSMNRIGLILFGKGYLYNSRMDVSRYFRG